MARILVYGYPSDWNFGGPSIILGFRELARRCRPDLEMVCYETAPLTPAAVAGYDFRTRVFPYRRTGRFWADWLMWRVFGKYPRDAARREFWKDFASAEAVVNLFGICFCSGPGRIKGPFLRLRALKAMLKKFSPNLAARLSRKKSVKCTCSYGPAKREFDRICARLASRYFFGVMVAREEESRSRLAGLSRGRRNTPVAPDVANLAPVPETEREDGLAGLVTSYKMEQEWKRDDVSYVDCMAGLARHARRVHGLRVALIPNQDGYLDGRPLRRGDTAVAKDILARLGGEPGVFVAETLGRPAMETKALLARCAVVVSPRYHACVAALSSGTPLLTLGWHEKYSELAALYGQERWMRRAEDCSAEELERAFDALFAARAVVSDAIRARAAAVRDAVVASGRLMLAAEKEDKGKGGSAG